MIYIGSIYPQNILDSIMQESSHADFAAHTFQTGIIEGLQKYYDDISVITSPVTSSYPKSHKIVYEKQNFFLNISDTTVPVFFSGFVNLPLIKLISEYIQIKVTLKNLLKGNDIVYIYALHTPFFLAAYSLRKRISKICVIIPDLPDHMSHNNGTLRRLLKRINKLIINKCLRTFPYHVLFSRFMESELPLEGKRWITVEGMYSSSNLPLCEKETKKTILYSGIISREYGVFDLIEAFHRIKNDDYQLWLCGSCPVEMNLLEEYIRLDSRINYLGMLSKEAVRTLQVRATLLVNPRHSHEEFTKFSFPSKTMEYLASGTPTLMCKLLAIPEEYNEHLFFFEDESINGFKKRIVEICNMNQKELKIQGKKAREFILQDKNCFTQAKRIFDMVGK